MRHMGTNAYMLYRFGDSQAILEKHKKFVETTSCTT